MSLALAGPLSAQVAAVSEGIHTGGRGAAHTALHMTHRVSFSLNPTLSVSQSVLPAGTEDAQLSRRATFISPQTLPVVAL